MIQKNVDANDDVDYSLTAKSDRPTPEPIAVIGIGCKFPGGADSPTAFWEFIEAGRDAIRETPLSRWDADRFYSSLPSIPGKSHSRWGGYIDDIDLFDPSFFGISPREAASIDPQHRMLLETSWRAFEDAGLRWESLAGKKVGVFVGISSFDYAVSSLSTQDRGCIGPYSNTGSSMSIAANRISYCYDLRGPSLSVDTACSSSLVAVHLACEALWRGDCTEALASGVNAILVPDFYVAFSQLGVLSRNGRCKTFDARADGYVRSEGAGTVVLKPLSAALRDGDDIYAVIRATAVNQDGRTPGLTVPSQQAQESLIREACLKAGVAPNTIGYVEAHGTGTPVGDPIEAAALGASVGYGRTPNNPCWVGSVKTNIGHLEAGAGIASLIKVALALKNRRIPRQIHFETPNPNINFKKLSLRVATESLDWESSTETRLAGVNGFGYGGTNAHVIMSEYNAAINSFPNHLSRLREEVSSPRTVATGSGFSIARQKPTPIVFPLSAKTSAALDAHLAELNTWLKTGCEPVAIENLADELSNRRSRFEERIALVAATKEELIAQIDARLDDGVSREQSKKRRSTERPIFVFCGQGSQWCGMGRRLLETNAEFQRVLEACDREFRKYGEWSLLEELARDNPTTRIHQTAVTQPSLFAIQVALAAAWKKIGVEPSVVVGHSVGEIAAAFVCGALSWRDACRVAFFRGRTMDRADSRGAMLAVGLSSTEIRTWLSGMNGHISIAAVNGPQSITLSGHADHIETVESRLQSASVFCRRLTVEYAFHSSQMEPVRTDLLTALSEIRPTSSNCPFVSTVTGSVVDGTELDANYWWRNVRETVRFAEAMNAALRLNEADVLEIGPHPALAYSIRECLSPGSNRRILESLRRDEDEAQSFAVAVSKLFESGINIDFPSSVSRLRSKLNLPPHPFQRKSYWSESRERRLSRVAVDTHPLLGEPVHGPNRHWGSRLDTKVQSYLTDHRVRGVVVYPAAAIIESAVEAARLSYEDTDEILLERLILHRPCVLSDEKPQWIECRHDPSRRSLNFYFRDIESDDAWSHLATVMMGSPSAVLETARLEQPAIQSRCTETFDRDTLYDFCRQLGLDYGERFRGVVDGIRRDGESLCRIDVENQDVDSSSYTFHPAILDACFHTMLAADDDFLKTVANLKLPAEIASIACRGPLPPKLLVHTRIVGRSTLRLLADIDIYTESGECCVSIRGFESRAVGNASLAKPCDELMYRYSWQPTETLTTPPESVSLSNRRWLIIGAESVFQTDLASALGDQSSTCGTDSEELIAALRDLANDEASDPGIIYLGTLDSPQNDVLTSESLWESRNASCSTPIAIVQAWERLAHTRDCRLVIPTLNAQIIDDEKSSPNVAQAPLIGVARVVSSEYARFKTKLVDFSSGENQANVELLVAELSAEDEEDEVLYRGEQRYVRRFDSIVNHQASAAARDALSFRLRRGRVPNIEEIEYETESTKDLQAHEVEIDVKAAGLNFSDVMKVLDLYPGLKDDRPLLGAECAGTILRVGADVSDWKVGDEVMAVAPGSLGNRVICSASLVARKPGGMSFDEAAAIPIAFLTADYALENCGAIRTGDRVLIHAASGGVGQAAIQIAGSKGATVFATCGNDEKRRFVAAQGVSHVMNSRDLSFVGETLDATNGEGVDLVLNSLPGEALEKGLTVLKPGGRFLEIGKRDIYADSPLGLYPMRNNLAFFAIDLDQLFKLQPKAMGERLRRLVPRFESGELKPLPTRVFQADETQAAFRWMQQSKHIGKIVVDYRKPPSRIRNGDYSPIEFRSDGTYWIVGGLGGFGIELAEWLTRKGAGTIVLSSRRTEVSPTVEARLQIMRDAGTNVVIHAIDLSKPESVCRTLHQIESSLPKLRGVFHTAMILEDRLLIDLDAATLDTVLAPKLLGGWHLHEALKQTELEHFVLFSSLTSIFGHAGQANYSAANAFLDSLAHYRQAADYHRLW